MLRDGARLVSGAYDQKIKVWNWSTGEQLNTIDTNLYIDSLTVITQITPISKVKLFYFHFFSYLYLWVSYYKNIINNNTQKQQFLLPL
jgi:WD40 repeat protein